MEFLPFFSSIAQMHTTAVFVVYLSSSVKEGSYAHSYKPVHSSVKESIDKDEPQPIKNMQKYSLQPIQGITSSQRWQTKFQSLVDEERLTSLM